jgi:MoaA/NifB/PqqE/SkfB family radical SAM enzyme
MNLAILYRGPLSSCNYGCGYCPFAKHKEARAAHEADRRALARFVDWVAARTEDRLSILFTPWGEALIRPRYQQALARLTNLPQVDKAAIQTNLSCRLEWVEDCDKGRLALWATYHPTQTTRARFLRKCAELDRRGVRYSVGVVGLREQADEIAALRRELPAPVYLWINAYKPGPDYYGPEDVRRLTDIDPLFPVNNRQHASRGRACHAGHTAISVDGDGTIRRCHFIRAPLGNIYAPGWEAALRPRPCTRAHCGCHIGYVHMPDLGLYETFGDGVLERIPARRIWAV